MKRSTSTGFTLVEMSIVLVIIGLILGGILIGEDLIRSSRLGSVIADLNKFKVYRNTFRLKYDALPGDIKNAYDYWGLALGCTNELATPDGTGCNGNGDGNIAWDDEGFRAWQHFAASEIMPGSYAGTATATKAVIGTNIPASRVDGGGYSLIYQTLYVNNIGNFIQFGSEAATINENSIISAVEAYGIDSKMDDGVAKSGKVFAADGAEATAESCIVAATSDYDLLKTTKSCRMYFTLE